jgi:hypothetical protein
LADSRRFLPPRRRGVIIHAVAGSLLLLSSATLFFLALQEQFGTYFVVFLLASLLLLIPLTMVLYRGYALLRAYYDLERDGLHLRWGLRSEDIPLANIDWVRPASDLVEELPQRLLAYPGAILGVVNAPGLGRVEYLASEDDELVLVCTPGKTYALSPIEPAAFITAFQHAFELGSLAELPPVSVQPAAYLRRVWDTAAARWLLLAGLGITLALLVVVALQIPLRSSVTLDFNMRGEPLEGVPATMLLLLPVLAIIFFFIDLIGGLYFFRKEEQRMIAFLLWGTAILLPLMMFAALPFILQT